MPRKATTRQEIERKFLVTGNAWRAGGRGILFRQGYLATTKACSVRVRIAGSRGFLTIKGRRIGISRPEYEYKIPIKQATAMLDGLCPKPLVEKYRYVRQHASLTWEIDEFIGENAGLILAEVELASPKERVTLPVWVGREVSDDPRYYNENLARRPYRTWGRKKR